jgi:hypothetical protein
VSLLWGEQPVIIKFGERPLIKFRRTGQPFFGGVCSSLRTSASMRLLQLIVMLLMVRHLAFCCPAWSFV